MSLPRIAQPARGRRRTIALTVLGFMTSVAMASTPRAVAPDSAALHTRGHLETRHSHHPRVQDAGASELGLDVGGDLQKAGLLLLTHGPAPRWGVPWSGWRPLGDQEFALGPSGPGAGFVGGGSSGVGSFSTLGAVPGRDTPGPTLGRSMAGGGGSSGGPSGGSPGASGPSSPSSTRPSFAAIDPQMEPMLPDDGPGPGPDGPPPESKDPWGTMPAAAVPEPSSWIMMILGVAAVGAVLRRRRAPPAIGLGLRIEA